MTRHRAWAQRPNRAEQSFEVKTRLRKKQNRRMKRELRELRRQYGAGYPA